MPNAHGDVDVHARIEGTIAAADAVREAVHPGDVLFLVVRQDDGGGSDRGTILGVKRFVVERLPIAFELDGRDAMFPGVKFAGRVVVTARVDKDGDATTKNAGDVLGVARAEVGTRDVRVVLDTITK
jgi:hypothetical protein